MINEDISLGLLAIFSAEASEALTRPLCAILTKYCPPILEKEKTRHFLPLQANITSPTILTTRCTSNASDNLVFFRLLLNWRRFNWIFSFQNVRDDVTGPNIQVTGFEEEWFKANQTTASTYFFTWYQLGLCLVLCEPHFGEKFKFPPSYPLQVGHFKPRATWLSAVGNIGCQIAFGGWLDISIELHRLAKVLL